MRRAWATMRCRGRPMRSPPSPTARVPPATASTAATPSSSRREPISIARSLRMGRRSDTAPTLLPFTDTGNETATVRTPSSSSSTRTSSPAGACSLTQRSSTPWVVRPVPTKTAAASSRRIGSPLAAIPCRIPSPKANRSSVTLSSMSATSRRAFTYAKIVRQMQLTRKNAAANFATTFIGIGALQGSRQRRGAAGRDGMPVAQRRSWQRRTEARARSSHDARRVAPRPRRNPPPPPRLQGEGAPT